MTADRFDPGTSEDSTAKKTSRRQGPGPLRVVLAGLGSALLALVVIALLLGIPSDRPLLADGGTLRVANVPMGAYRVNVFTDPTPIPPDSIDVSVLVTFERGRGIARGLAIEVEARPVGAPEWALSHPATREQAEDPRYYAAKFALGSVGEWELEVRVRGPEGEGAVRFQVSVQEPGPLDNPFLILGLALAPLFLIGWWLKQTGGAEAQTAVSTPPDE
jgi:hypothetical protein